VDNLPPENAASTRFHNLKFGKKERLTYESAEKTSPWKITSLRESLRKNKVGVEMKV